MKLILIKLIESFCKYIPMIQENTSKFVISNEGILRLSQFPQEFSYKIKVEDHYFKFNQEQIIFLSIPVYEYFLNQTKPFVISVDEYQSSMLLISSNLIDCFSRIHSLFFTCPQVEFTQNEQPYLEFLAKILDNHSLLQVSRQLVIFEKFSFSFNSTRFSHIPPEYRSDFNNFSLIINKTSFDCNISFFSCLSNLIFDILTTKSNIESLDLGIKPQEYLNIIQLLFTIFDGLEFPIGLILQNPQLIPYLFEIFGDLQIPELYPFLKDYYPVPNSPDSAFSFF